MSTFVIPMAGFGRRFSDAGYATPKYALPLGTGTVFDWSVASFERYFTSDEFVFVTRDDAASAFVAERCRLLGIADARTVQVGTTRGQAETVTLALRGDERDVFIFNVDTVRPGFTKPGREGAVGHLETFVGEGDGWSFVEPADPAARGDRADRTDRARVRRTAEKERISALCSTGLYWFDAAADLQALVTEAQARGAETWQAGELYVAPLYNRLIAAGATVTYDVVEPDAVWFSGVPDEYEALAASLAGRSPLTSAQQSR